MCHDAPADAWNGVYSSRVPDGGGADHARSALADGVFHGPYSVLPSIQASCPCCVPDACASQRAACVGRCCARFFLSGTVPIAYCDDRSLTI